MSTTKEALTALLEIPGVEDIEVADLKPCDVLVIECDRYVSVEDAERIDRYIQQIWPDRKCLLLGEGLHLKIVRETDA